MLTDHIDLAAAGLLQLKPEPRVVKQAAAGVKLHQQIDITLFVRFTRSNGAEYPHISGAVLCGDSQNLFAPGLHQIFSRPTQAPSD